MKQHHFTLCDPLTGNKNLDCMRIYICLKGINNDFFLRSISEIFNNINTCISVICDSAHDIVLHTNDTELLNILHAILQNTITTSNDIIGHAEQDKCTFYNTMSMRGYNNVLKNIIKDYHKDLLEDISGHEMIDEISKLEDVIVDSNYWIDEEQPISHSLLKSQCDIIMQCINEIFSLNNFTTTHKTTHRMYDILDERIKIILSENALHLDTLNKIMNIAHHTSLDKVLQILSYGYAMDLMHQVMSNVKFSKAIINATNDIKNEHEYMDLHTEHESKKISVSALCHYFDIMLRIEYLKELYKDNIINDTSVINDPIHMNIFSDRNQLFLIQKGILSDSKKYSMICDETYNHDVNSPFYLVVNNPINNSATEEMNIVIEEKIYEEPDNQQCTGDNTHIMAWNI